MVAGCGNKCVKYLFFIFNFLFFMYIILYALAAIGGLLCLTGFLGCCGACCESPCLLGLFFTVVLVLFVAKIAGAIYIFVKKDTIKVEFSTWYKENLIGHYDTNPDVRNALDQLQKELECCGANGCDDYNTTAKPTSCKCKEDENRKGCVDLAFEKVTEHMILLSAVAIAILAVELLALIFSCIICDAIRNDAYDYY